MEGMLANAGYAHNKKATIEEESNGEQKNIKIKIIHYGTGDQGKKGY